MEHDPHLSTTLCILLFWELNNILEDMSRVVLLERYLPAATEMGSGTCWDTGKDLTHLYAAATLG